MNFLRALSTRSRGSLLKAIAITAGGSGFLFASTDTLPDRRIAISITHWKVPEFLLSYPFTLPAHHAHGNALSFSSQVGSVPSSDPNKPKFGASRGSPEPSNRFLGRDTIANAAAKVGPTVANISVTQGVFGITAKRMGSGTIIDPDGTILTCAHLVTDFHGARPSTQGKIEVTLQDGRTFDAAFVNADLHSDIALIKIVNSRSPLPAATLGSSSKLRPGDWVLALGCPLTLQNTVTAGIISCVDRKSNDMGLGGIRREYLQTDCAINDGNSGGPLVNVDGEVVGVNTMKLVPGHGLGFAVPVDSVTKIISQFKKSGRVIRPWLGLKMIDLNSLIIAQLKERDPKFPNVDKGILVPSVTPGSPADRAGFHPGDVVIQFDRRPVESINEVYHLCPNLQVLEIMGDRIGVPLQVTVKRANDISVTLTVIPEEANPDI